MCGNFISNPIKTITKEIKNPLRTVEKAVPYILDAAAIAAGQPELLPLTQGVGTAISGTLQGQPLGKALTSGAISGAETFAGQELLGGFTSAFPETSAAISSGASDLSSSIPGYQTASDYLSQAGNAIGDAASSVKNTISSDINSAENALGIGTPTVNTPSVDVAAGSAPTAVNSITANTPLPTASDLSGTPAAPTTYTGANAEPSVPLGAATPPASGLQSLVNNVSNSPLGTAGKFLKDNASLIMPAGGLAMAAMNANKTLPGQNALTASAAQQAAQGAQYQSYLANGTLPPAMQAGITQATQQVEAAIRSKYAQMGMSGSSAEQAELQNATVNAQQQGFQAAQSLMNTGVAETNAANNIYTTILKNATAQDTALQQALAGFGASVAKTATP